MFTPIRSRSGVPSFWKGRRLFGDTAKAEAAPAIDVKVLHAKIGELTLANDFLEGALDKAGLLPSARK